MDNTPVVNAFEFASAGQILFGPGRFKQVPELQKRLGERWFLITGGTSRQRVECAGAHAIRNEPSFDDIRAAVAAARKARCDAVIAVGGGSALDAGKAVAMLLANGGDPLDYAEIIGAGKAVHNRSVPLIAVPTTSGTGSEVTRNAVLFSPEHQLKVSLRSPLMLPAVALVDPELTLGLPPGVTSHSGMDALSQLVEPFVSSKANPMTDALAREMIPRAAAALGRCFRAGDDRAARADMALASVAGGLCLANAGLGVVHAFASPIGGLFGAPHGAICAALLAPAMRINRRAARERHAGAALKFGELEHLLPVGVVERLAEELEIPRLSHWKIGATDFPGLIEKARATSSMKGNPIELTDEELREVLQLAT